jgi:predicted nucleic acid-binding protein
VTFLLDTNAINDIARQHPVFQTRIDALPTPHRLVTCSIVRGAILFGLERMPAGRRRSDAVGLMLPALKLFDCVEVSAEVADEYARVKRACQQKGTPLDENDLWIAGTALWLGAALVTRDTDLSHVPGLRIEDWTK